MFNNKTIQLTLTLLLLLSSMFAHAGVITVDSAADPATMTNDGNCTLREAVDAANSGNTVDTCVPGLGTFTIKFAGSLSGSTITLGGSELVISSALTIDGGNNNITISGNNTSRIFSTSQPLTLKSLTLTGGNSSNGTNHGHGGAILTTANLTIDNSTLSGNKASRSGGAIYAAPNSHTAISVTLTNSTLSDNSANGGSGGAIYAMKYPYAAMSVTLTNSVLKDNKANNGFGGAVYTYDDTTLTLTNSRLTGNSAISGGAIYASQSTVTATNSTLSGNTAIYGGALYFLSFPNNVTLTRSTLSDNQADSGGGAIYFGGGRLEVANSTLSGNQVSGSTSLSGRGGAIHTYANTVISNSTLSGNSVANGNGGVIYVGGGTLTLNSNVVLGNAESGTINTCYINRGNVDASNSADNILDAACGGVAATAPAVSLSDVLVTQTTGSNSIEPLLADNGCTIPAGGTSNAAACVQTIALKPGTASVTNPAIDAGVAHGTSGDQRGFGHVGTPDVGAYEFGAGIMTLSITPSAGGAVSSSTPTHTGGINACTAGSSQCAAEYLNATAVVLNVVAHDHHTFTGWDGDCSGTDNPLTLTVDADKTCQALFVSQAPTLNGLPNMPQEVTQGVAATLVDFTVADADSSQVSVTLTANNGSVVDANGVAVNSLATADLASINAQLADLQFVASHSGVASIAITVTDGSGLTASGVYYFGVIPPTNQVGSVVLSGVPQQGDVLTATVSDADGVPSTGITYLWEDQAGNYITAAHDVNNYLLTVAEVGKQVKVIAIYTDNAGNREVVESALTAVVAANSYTVGGSVTGLLSGNSITLQNNGGDDITMTADGTFTFSTAIVDGGTYAVTVSQPTGQTCTVNNGSGTINAANVSNVQVTCSANSYTVSGNVNGLNGSITLQNNGGDDITMTADGTFTFSTAIAHGSNYAVTVSQPTGQTCTVNNGSGTINAANVNSVQVICSANSYTVGGSVNGLSGSVTLQNNGGDDLTLTADGTFTFTAAIAHGSNYIVLVSSQPAGQTCTVSNGTGMATANVSNVQVTCATTPTYTIGGTISGLSGTVVLQNNGGDDITMTADGAFTFSTAIAHGSNYTVTVSSQPAGQTCTVSNGTGTATADVSNVQVICSANSYTVGGSVNGLSGSVTLQNNGGDDLTLTANGTFTFSTAIAHGSNYTVTVSSQPAGQTCTVSNGTGTATANVSNVQVTCAATSTYTIGGTISGLSGTVVLQNNGGDNLTINADGSFTFPTGLPNGAAYNITVLTPPTGQSCTISNGSGTVNGGNIGNIQIACRAADATPVPAMNAYGMLLMLLSMLGVAWFGVRRS